MVPGGAPPPTLLAAPVEVPSPPLPVVHGTPNPDEPATTGEQEKPRPFWKDPIVVVGAAVPTAILLGFFAYLYLQHSARVFRDRVHSLKAQADHLDRSSQYRSAFVKYEQLLRMSRDWRGGDRELRDDFVATKQSRDRLYPAVKRDLEREESERRAKQEADRLAAQPKPVVVPVVPRLVPDYTDWRMESSFEWVDGYATCVAFAPDGRTIVVGGGTSRESGRNGVPFIQTGMLRTWDIETKEAKLSVADPDDQVESVSFYPDGSSLAVGYREKVWVINAESGALRFRLSGRVPGQMLFASVSGYRPAAINQKYRLLVTEGDHLWDSANGAFKGYLTGGRGYGVFSNDGSLYFAKLTVYTVSSWDTRCKIFGGEIATFSHDSKLLATEYGFWNVSDCQELWKGASGYATGIAFTPDDKFLLTSHIEGDVKITEVATGRLAGKFRPHDHVAGMSLSPDGRLLVTVNVSPGQPVKVWRVALKPAS